MLCKRMPLAFLYPRRLRVSLVVFAGWLGLSSTHGVEISREQHLGREHFVITTAAATYKLDPVAGGFSSILDRNGNDWVAYQDPASADYPAGAAFAYRGLPNLVHGGEDSGAGHPGFARCESWIESDRRIVSRTKNQKWQWTWEFFDSHVQLNIDRIDGSRKYWFLYEGPIGGSYEPDRSFWGSDLSGPIDSHPDFYRGETRFDSFHWLYFGHQTNDQMLWIAQVEPDDQPDLYSQLGNTTAGINSPDGMTVAGFGRGPNTEPRLGRPLRFLIGMQDRTSHEQVAQHIERQIKNAGRGLHFPTPEWATSTPRAQGFDSEKFAAALAVLESYSGDDGLSETLITNRGQIIFSGDKIDKSHNIYSCTKSLTSTVLGLLIAEGKCSLDSRAADWEPSLEKHYPHVTLRHFATMTSGYSAAGNSRWDEESEDWGWTPFEPVEPYFAPGTAYAYWDEAMMMYGRVLTKIAGEDLHSYLDRKVFSRIGMGEWDWWYDQELADGTPLRNGCTGITINAEQLARLGLLFLNDGVWQDERVLPEGWVERATRHHVAADLPIGDTDRKNVLGNGRYGLNWWVRGEMGDMPDTPPGTYYMSGLHNNMCFVIPEWNMVIVRRGEDGNPPEGKRFVYNAFFKALGAAIDD
ncbi:MAG: hypothetical protein SynsKO_05550 [Synoicihabitans sp.]